MNCKNTTFSSIKAIRMKEIGFSSAAVAFCSLKQQPLHDGRM